MRCYNERKLLQNDAKPGRPSEGVTIELMNSIDAEMERNDEMTSPELAQRIFKEFRIHFSWPKSQTSLATNLRAKQYKVIGILHVVPKRE